MKKIMLLILTAFSFTSLTAQVSHNLIEVNRLFKEDSAQLPKLYNHDISTPSVPTVELLDWITKPYLVTYTPKTVSLANGRTGQYIIKEFDSFVQDSIYIKRSLLHSTCITFDSLPVFIVLNQLPTKNVGAYEFRVQLNKQDEIVSWRPITLFCNNQFTFPQNVPIDKVGYIGSFKCSLGNNLTIDVRNKHSKQIIASSSILWVKRSPQILSIFSGLELAKQFADFKKQGQNEMFSQLFGHQYDDSIATPIRQKFGPEETTLTVCLDDRVISKEMIEYRWFTKDDSIAWKPNDYDFNYIQLRKLIPGEYTLQLRYSIQRNTVTSFSFEILPHWYQKSSWKLVFCIMICLLLLFMTVFFYKRRLRKVEQKKKQVNLELKSIRSQLNPHFVFNALTSIQGLINNNQKEYANKYLTEFAGLLRTTLDANEKDFLPLELEIKTIDSYIQLERLRFNFSYELKIDNSIQTSIVEVPSLLIQPLVENAIKHGIASLQQEGKLLIQLSKEQNNLVVSITDNGKGFNQANKFDGYGLKLTKERIALLKQFNKQQPIELSIETNQTDKTIVLLTFKNWLQ